MRQHTTVSYLERICVRQNEKAWQPAAVDKVALVFLKSRNTQYAMTFRCIYNDSSFSLSKRLVRTLRTGMLNRDFT